MTDFTYDTFPGEIDCFAPAAGRQGVYPSQWIADAIRSGIVILASPIGERQIQPNSLDVRLGRIAYRVNCSFLPGRERMSKKLANFKWYDVEIAETGTILERNQVYLFPLQEQLALPDHIAASANPKSTTGRLDVFTRLVIENGMAFDEIPAGYHGPLYVEVVPRSFAIKVRPGDSLAQVRFHSGRFKLTDDETRDLLDHETLVLLENHRSHDYVPLRSKDLRVSGGLMLSISLSGKQRDSVIGYKARKNQKPVDLQGRTSIRRYWENIHGDKGPIILEPDEFYIFASKELVRLPPEFCAEMVPFDPGSGELRTHYAGFFDSGFGFEPTLSPALTAAAVVLEIRNRDVPFLIEEGVPLFRLIILRNTDNPAMLYGRSTGSHYQSQRLRLSKQFRSDDADEAPVAGQGQLAF